MIILSKTLRLFLDSIGRRDEYEFYLDKFQAAHEGCFALLCPDPDSIKAGSEVLAFDLHFLLRLQLIPAILLCGPKAQAMADVLAQETVFTFFMLDENWDAEQALDVICRARTDEKVPVLMTEISQADALSTLLPTVSSRVHFIRAAGGLRSAEGEELSYAYTHRENPVLLDSSGDELVKLAGILLDHVTGLHVSVTSPINLLQEIFTVKGSGTVLRKGSVVHHYSGMNGVDRSLLVALLEKSFGKNLVNDAFMESVCDAYIVQDYRGAVLMEQLDVGCYLSKYAVGKEARGEGVAVELWNTVCQNHGAFFWRSNANNPFNSWYEKQADGCHRGAGWHIFWRGVAAEKISAIIAYCCERGEDFISNASKES